MSTELLRPKYREARGPESSVSQAILIGSYVSPSGDRVGFSGPIIVDDHNGKIIGSVEEELGTSIVVGQRKKNRLLFSMLSGTWSISWFPRVFDLAPLPSGDWDGVYSQVDLTGGPALIFGNAQADRLVLKRIPGNTTTLNEKHQEFEEDLNRRIQVSVNRTPRA
jgi:hypothetical protein